MSLDSILSTAASGLASINNHLAVVSQNVANAGTAGYAREVVSDTDLSSGGAGYGVRSGLATREVDDALQTALGQQSADVAGLQVRSTALASVDAAQGVTGAGNDLASRVGALAGCVHRPGRGPGQPGEPGQRRGRRRHPGRRHPNASRRLCRREAGRAGRLGE